MTYRPNIRQITADMDDEDRNVAHSLNAREYFRAGDLDSAAAEVALDRGFHGTFAEWLEWAKISEARAAKEAAAHRAMAETLGWY